MRHSQKTHCAVAFADQARKKVAIPKDGRAQHLVRHCRGGRGGGRATRAQGHGAAWRGQRGHQAGARGRPPRAAGGEQPQRRPARARRRRRRGLSISKYSHVRRNIP